MKKKIFVMGIVLSLLLGLSLTAYADDVPTATFDGSSTIKYNYDTANFGTNFNDMMPGQTKTQDIRIQNSYSRTVSFFMKQEVLKSFEDTVSASNAAYEITLSLISGGDTTVIYGSGSGAARIGGDGRGLSNLNETLDGWIFLTTLDSGKSATLRMEVGLDGESVVNDYQGAQGTFSFQFQASYDDPVVETVTVKGKDNVVIKTVKKNTLLVKTEDDTPLLILIAVLGTASVVIGVVLAGKRRNNKTSD